MLSDWHIGVGAGRSGDAHRLVRRDSDQLPYLPGKTLTGILRDACEQVAYGLDNGDKDGIWGRWVDYLFGDQPSLPQPARTDSPRPAAFTVSSAHLSVAIRRALAGKDTLRTAATFTKPGVAIDATSGRAKDHCLRYVEMARVGMVLHAEATVAIPSDVASREAVAALLWAGARVARHIGGGRRRGSGKCAISLALDHHEGFLAILTTTPPEPPRHQHHVVGGASPALSGDWVCLDLCLTTNSPVVVPAQTVGNVVERLDYIPGTYLLRLMTERCAYLGVDVRQAIARGDLIVTHALPMIGNTPGRTFPAALQQEKSAVASDTTRWHNLFFGPPFDEQLTGNPDGFISAQRDHVDAFRARLSQSVVTHSIVDDETQRPITDSVGVYSLQTIPARTCLRAQLRMRKSIADALSVREPHWWETLAGHCRIGLAKKGEYGDASLAVSAAVPFEHTSIPAGGRLYVWLLSDLLLRDAHLRPTADVNVLVAVLSEKLKGGLTLVDAALPAIAVAGRQHRTESWHVGWGLPRPSLAGLSAGTCVALVTSAPLDAEALGELELSGIGERRAEGYGQVVVNDPLLMRDVVQIHNGEVTREEPSDTPALAAEDHAVVAIIERAAWHDAIRRISLQLAADPKRRTDILGIAYCERAEPDDVPHATPSISQLMALLTMIQQAESLNDSVIDQWRRHIDKTKGRKKEWEKSRDAIEKLLTDKERVWHCLFGESAAAGQAHPDIEPLLITDLVVNEAAIPVLQEKYWSLAVWTLADACIRAHTRYMEGAVSNTSGTQGGDR